MYKIIFRLVLFIVTSLTLVSCKPVMSESTWNILNFFDSNQVSASRLIFIAPRSVLSVVNKPSSAYIVVRNPEKLLINNIKYSVANLIGSAANVRIDSKSSDKCKSIGPLKSCVIKITVLAGAGAGSFNFVASNGVNISEATTAKTDSSYTDSIGVRQIQYNNLPDANGVILNYYKYVAAGTNIIQISGVVASKDVGHFNNIILVNESGNKLHNQKEISNNLGAGFPDLKQGDTFSILIHVPNTTNTTQTFKVETQKITADGRVINEHISNSVNVINTFDNVGFISLLPATVYLTRKNPKQYITLDNIGNIPATLSDFHSNNPDVEVTFIPATLYPNGTTIAILKLKNNINIGDVWNATLNYKSKLLQNSMSHQVRASIETIYTNIGKTIIRSQAPSPIPKIDSKLLVDFPDRDFLNISLIHFLTAQ